MSYFLDPVAVTNFPSVVQFFANNTLFWLNKHSWHPLQHHTCTSIRNLLLHMPSHASRISQLADIAFKQSMTILLPCVSRWDGDKYSSVKSCSSTKNGTTSSATIKLYLLVSLPAPEASPTCSSLPKRAISTIALCNGDPPGPPSHPLTISLTVVDLMPQHLPLWYPWFSLPPNQHGTLSLPIPNSVAYSGGSNVEMFLTVLRFFYTPKMQQNIL